MTRTILLTAALSILSCTQSPPSLGDSGTPQAFQHRVDPSLAAKLPQGPKPLASARTEAGTVHLFVAGQLLVASTDRAEVDALLQRVGGQIVGDDAVPLPPASANLTLDPALLTPTQYVVQVDLSKADVSALDADASKIGLSGDTAFSDEGAVKLLALIAHEKANGLRTSPNFAFQGDLIESSREHPVGPSFFDPMAQPQFLATGSRSNVVGMWQHVAGAPPARRAYVAIIDNGFWLDGAGRPMSSLTPWASDFPEAPLQYDFSGNDYVADGPNAASCTAGTPCPWHGNGAAGVAVGAFDNRYGGAGTGGQVAEPMLFRTSLDWGERARAIRTAVAWRADVISMSFGASCDNVFCDGFFEFNLYPALRNARDNGVVLVAAAGNETQSANGMVPCKAAEDVICVGALDDGTTNATWYSNSGSSVAIWAPTNILTHPDPLTAPELKSFGGTSASTPFVAGVAAVLRAYDSTLTSAQVKAIFQRTAWRGSSDPRVRHVLDAYRALREVSSANTAPAIDLLVIGDVQLGVAAQVRAVTRDLEDGRPCCTVTWIPAPDASSDSGRSVLFTFRTEGAHVIRATATDRAGLTTTSELSVVARNSAPAVELLQPALVAAIYAGQPIQLSARATDVNEPMGVLDCARLQWTSGVSTDPGFPVSGCEATVTFPSPGARTLVLTAEDPQGAITRAYRTITIGAAPVNYPPMVTMGALPPTTYDTGHGSDVAFNVSASATDPEGNAPLTYRWYATVYAPGSTTVVSSPRALLVPSSTVTGNLSWVPDTTATRFATFATVGNDCYLGQSVRLELEVTDSLLNRTTRTLPLFKVFVCRLE